MKIRMIRPTYLNRRLIMATETVDARERIAKDLIQTGRAIEVDEASNVVTDEQEQDDNGNSTWQ